MIWRKTKKKCVLAKSAGLQSLTAPRTVVLLLCFVLGLVHLHHWATAAVSFSSCLEKSQALIVSRDLFYLIWQEVRWNLEKIYDDMMLYFPEGYCVVVNVLLNCLQAAGPLGFQGWRSLLLYEIRLQEILFLPNVIWSENVKSVFGLFHLAGQDRCAAATQTQTHHKCECVTAANDRKCSLWDRCCGLCCVLSPSSAFTQVKLCPLLHSVI